MTNTQRPWPPSRAIGDQEPLLTTGEVARRLRMSPRTVLAWCQAGKLPSILTLGRHRRIPESAVDRLMVPRNELTGEEVRL
jgi:excisionase family DNA binding protein